MIRSVVSRGFLSEWKGALQRVIEPQHLKTYMRRAIVLGSTGFVGSYLLQALLDSPDYARVTAIVRRPLAVSHAKVEVLIGDYHTLPGLRSEIRGDDLFI